MNALMLSKASSAVERVHLLLWEPSWLHPEAAQVFQHQNYWRRVWGGGGKKEEQKHPAQTQPRSWIQLGLLDLALHQLYQIHAASQLLHLLHGVPCPTGQAQRDEHHKQSHGLARLVVLGTGCERGAERETALWSQCSGCYEELTELPVSKLNSLGNSWHPPCFSLPYLYHWDSHFISFTIPLPSRDVFGNQYESLTEVTL